MAYYITKDKKITLEILKNIDDKPVLYTASTAAWTFGPMPGFAKPMSSYAMTVILYYSINPAIRSRVQIFELADLTEEALIAGLKKLGKML